MSLTLVTGVVTYIKPEPNKGGYYSIKLDDKDFYGLADKKSPQGHLNLGDTVSFDSDIDERYPAFKIDTLKIVEKAEAKNNISGGGKKSTGTWVDTSQEINWTASRKHAIETVGMMLEHSILSMPKAKDAGVPIVEAMIAKYTQEYFDTQSVKDISGNANEAVDAEGYVPDDDE